MDFRHNLATLKNWLNRRNPARPPCTADEMIGHIKKVWPNTTEAELERLYQAVGSSRLPNRRTTATPRLRNTHG